MPRATLILCLLISITVVGCISGSGTPSGDSQESDTATLDAQTPSSTNPISTNTPITCPQTEGLGITYPEELNKSTVRNFAVQYEQKYSQKDMSTISTDEPHRVNDGYMVNITISRSVTYSQLVITAKGINNITRSGSSNISEITDNQIRALVLEAEKKGTAQLTTQEIENYNELLSNLSQSYQSVDERGEESNLTINTNRSTVSLSVELETLHGDYPPETYGYYITEKVVWRSEATAHNHRNHVLLECRY